MTTRVLCVDDDSNILLGYQRALRKQFQIEVALGGAEGLAAVRNRGPYAVIVADMRMPDMNGVELLAQVREIAPDTVRMMLTGNADQQTALVAVNQGHIFRFMTKPCAAGPCRRVAGGAPPVSARHGGTGAALEDPQRQREDAHGRALVGEPDGLWTGSADPRAGPQDGAVPRRARSCG